jgi:hypothetical protein
MSSADRHTVGMVRDTRCEPFITVAASLKLAEGDDAFGEKPDNSTPFRSFQIRIQRGPLKDHYIVRLPKLPKGTLRTNEQILECPSIAIASEIVASFFCHGFPEFSSRDVKLLFTVSNQYHVFYGPLCTERPISQKDAYSFIVEKCKHMEPMLSCYRYCNADALREAEGHKKRKIC